MCFSSIDTCCFYSPSLQKHAQTLLRSTWRFAKWEQPRMLNNTGKETMGQEDTTADKNTKISWFWSSDTDPVLLKRSLLTNHLLDDHQASVDELSNSSSLISVLPSGHVHACHLSPPIIALLISILQMSFERFHFHIRKLSPAVGTRWVYFQQVIFQCPV